MSDPIADPRFAPPGSPSVRAEKAPLAAHLLLCLVIYGAAFGAQLVVLGALMNEVMFFGGLVHLGLAALFFVAWKGVLARKGWSRWLTMVLALLGILGPPLAILATWMNGGFKPALLAFPGLLSFYFSALLWAISRPSVDHWLAGRERKPFEV